MRNLINTEQSYTAKEIKEWCVQQIKDETENQIGAEEIYWNYWRNADIKPNSNVYYFVEYYRDYKGLMTGKLYRDLVKSPRTEKRGI